MLFISRESYYAGFYKGIITKMKHEVRLAGQRVGNDVDI
jgi:hypothetical protein